MNPPAPKLGKRDLEMVNTALGAYEAEDWQAVFGWSDRKAEAHYRQLAKTRAKIHALLAMKTSRTTSPTSPASTWEG